MISCNSTKEVPTLLGLAALLWCVNSWARMWGEGTQLLEEKQIPENKSSFRGLWETSSASVPTLSSNQKPMPGTRIEFKIITQRFNSVSIQ